MRRFGVGLAAVAAVLLAPASARAQETLAGALPLMGAALKVGSLPAEAEIVFASAMAGEKDAWGFPVRELYAARADGTHVARLTYSGFNHNHFEVSPDRTLIFTNRWSRGDTNHDGKLTYADFKELWLIDLKHHTERRVLEGVDGGYGGVAWSPDGRSVYYTVLSDRVSDVYRWPISGGPPQLLTADLNRRLGMPGDKRWISDIDISPDGRWLAGAYHNGDIPPGKPHKNQIAIFRVDGTAARLITDGGPLGAQMRGMWSVGDFDPDWSPDGRSVSFMRVTDRALLKSRPVSSADILRINVDGTGLARLSARDNGNEEGISSWGDACLVLWSSWGDDGPPRLKIARSDGTGLHTLPIPDATFGQWIPRPGRKPAKACPAPTG